MSHGYKSDKRRSWAHPDTRMDKMVNAARVGRLAEFVGASQLDRSRIPGWISTLREAETEIRHLRVALQDLLDGEERVCWACGTPITGRADKTLCSARCRKRVSRGAATPYAP